MTPPRWIQWVPQNAPAHITGRYTERVYDAEARAFESQSVEARCSCCSTTFHRTCESGRPREWIAKFTAVHRACKAS